MEKIKVVLDEGAMMPTRAHDTDAGWDLYAPKDAMIMPNGCIKIDTGVHFQLPKGTVGFVKSRSSLMVKNGINTDGVIDSGYTGSIGVVLFGHESYFKKIEAGDRIAQLVILKLPEVELYQGESMEDTDRGDGGFGSTGR